MVRRTVARVALGLLALSAAFAFGGATDATIDATTIRPTVDSSATTGHGRDRSVAFVAAPSSGAEWTALQQRGSSGADRSIAILVAIVALLLCRQVYCTDAVRDRIRVALRSRGSGIRGPPAFA